MKALAKFRLLRAYHLLAIDGTGHLVFKERHCPFCLSKEKNGKILYYYHNVLEAKIVTDLGLAISVETEFILNSDGASKQDCELKAFYRLTERLKKRFPQLKICLLLDSLYAALGNGGLKKIPLEIYHYLSERYSEFLNHRFPRLYRRGTVKTQAVLVLFLLRFEIDRIYKSRELF